MLKKFYEHVKKNYHLYSFISNILMATAMGGLAFLGVLTDAFTLRWLIVWGVMFAVMYVAGKLLNEEIEDIDEVTKHESIESN